MILVEEDYRICSSSRSEKKWIFKTTVSITYDIYSPKVWDSFLW